METINPYASPDEREGFEQPPQTSKLAIASLVCGLVFCCPVTTLLAPLLGIAHFVAAAGKPWVRGAGLAIGGILLGLVMSAGWGFVAWSTYKLFDQAMRLPQAAFAALSASDVAEFRSMWQGLAEGSEGDAQITAFRQDLEARYGAFESMRIDEQGQQPPPAGSQAFTLPFIATFAGTDGASVEVPVIVTFMPSQVALELKLVLVEFLDADRGDLVFPGPDGAPELAAPRESSDADGAE